MLRSLVGWEMCIRDRYQRRVRGRAFTVGMVRTRVASPPRKRSPQTSLERPNVNPNPRKWVETTLADRIDHMLDTSSRPRSPVASPPGREAGHALDQVASALSPNQQEKLQKLRVVLVRDRNALEAALAAAQTAVAEAVAGRNQAEHHLKLERQTSRRLERQLSESAG
eukprot:TRINITY_DN17782_c0_g1_i1.p1 TRINITY_DN17782_c0_g1~~TRINITY_DN17782_c0_g1_i1.p1  ORF type:complete len:168 (-),score=36.50 TRINITY_DN17782_c0_g1_i1:35-538(-)